MRARVVSLRLASFRLASIRLAAALLLVGCPTPEATPTVGEHAGGEADARPRDPSRDRDEHLRAGAITPGQYLFEIAGEDGVVGRREGYLLASSGDELDVRMDGPTMRLSRASAWPMLCLQRALSFGDGELRITLDPGAPVYVIAADAVSARVGPVPDVSHGRVVDRDALSLEGCTDEVRAAERRVGAAQGGDTACLFPDQDPADETDGLAVPAGAPLELLEDDGEWARVRVMRAGSAIEGWIDATLVADASEAPPDWCACALRPDRCVFPGRSASAVQSRAWIERSDASAPMPSSTIFEDTLRAADPRVRGCWDELDPALRPARTVRVEVRIDVDGDGQVSSAQVLRAEHAPESLARCIAERVHRVRFPAPRSGVVLRRTYAFDPEPTESVADEDDL